MMIEEEEEEYNLRWRKRKGRNGGDIEEAEGTSGQEEDNERDQSEMDNFIYEKSGIGRIISYMKNQESDG